MPRRATGGRQGGGTSWHHQTTAPGGRWQHEVEVPRAVRPEVRWGRRRPHCPATASPAAQRAQVLPGRRPPQPQGPRQLSLGSNSSPITFLSSREPARETQVLPEPRNPCPSCRKLALSPGQVRAAHRSPVLTGEELAVSSPPPAPPSPLPHHTPKCRSQEFLPHFPLG